MSFRIHFQDVPHSDSIREECEATAGALRAEFPETSKVEVTLTHTGEDHSTHVHVTGKDLDLASRAESRELREALNEAFERVRKQLRKHHDKVIFGRRREAQKASHK